MSPTFRRVLRSFLLCVVLGFFPLMALWRNNLGQISAGAVRSSLLGTALYVLLVFGIWMLLSRSPEKTALLSLVTAIFVFSYGHLFMAIGTQVLFGVMIGYAKLLLVCLAVFAGFVVWILKARRVFDPFFLIFPFGLLVVFNLISIVGPAIHFDRTAEQPVDSPTVMRPDEESLPDIYYIVLDAYARRDVLEKVIGYDNSAFLEALQTRGFYLPQCAFSNYDGTVVTLASVLNYDMLDVLGASKNSQGAYQTINTDLIKDSLASKIFRSYGYQFVTGRGYADFNDVKAADVYLNYAIEQGIKDDLAEKRFTSLYLNTTVFRAFSELYENSPGRFAWVPSWLVTARESDDSLEEANFWYRQNNYMFDALQDIPDWPGNYFVYAHINAPHGPYVFRADGSFRYPLDDQEETVRYADAITYVNKRMLEVVDALLEKSQPAPIIIIQGDHGIHGLTGGVEKHKILSAYYLPGNLATPPYDTITPVNNFRLILRNYFDPSVQLLPDNLWVKPLNDYTLIPASCTLEP